jgi:hypothetical protein
MADGNENIQIYNNVFFIGEGSDVQLFLWTVDGGKGTRNAQIANNIFYAVGTGRNARGVRRRPDGTFATEPGFGASTEIIFERNVLYGNFQDVPNEWRRMMTDPKLVSPGAGGNGLDSLEGYKLRPDSPCIGAGLPVKNNGGRDFWGNPAPEEQNPSIGAHERRK